MKTRNLFLSLFAFAAICACNKEAQPEGPKVPQILEEDACINVSIVSDNLDTRADTDAGFSDGDSDENAVTNALFAFFDNTGKYLYSVSDKEVTWTDAKKDTPAVERISEAVVVLKRQSITPTQMVVVLNYGDDIAKYFGGEASDDINDLDDMYTVLYTSNFAYNNGGKNYFTMSNSSYWSDGKNAFAAQISDDNIYTMSEKPDGKTEQEYRNEQTPVEVYVERVAAKLSVVGKPTGTSMSLELHDGSTLSYYPVIKKYDFTYTTNASWVCKNIEDLNASFNSSWSTWTDDDHMRSYWANTYGSAGLNKLKYSEISGAPDASEAHEVYCHENTTSSPVKLIVLASLKDASNDSDLEVVRVGTNDYYVVGDLLKAVATEFNNNGTITKSDASPFTEANFTFVDSEDPTAASYESDLALAEGVTLSAGQAEADNILAKYAKVIYWGKDIYFFTDVQHFGPEGVGDVGVVRNHYYKLTVNSIKGLGTPYVPGVGGGEEPIDPVVPDNVEHELQAKINILKWKVVSQNVDLK